MKHKLLLALLLFLWSVAVEAVTLRQLFMDMPDSICPTLSKSGRADLFGFSDHNMTAEVKTRYGGVAELVEEGEDFLEVRLSGVRTLQMKRFSTKKGFEFVCVVHTCCGEVCDSRISFYDTEWNPALNNYLDIRPQLESALRLKYGLSDSLDVVLPGVRVSPVRVVLSSGFNGIEYLFEGLDQLGLKEYGLKFQPVRSVWKRGRKQFRTIIPGSRLSAVVTVNIQKDMFPHCK